MEPVYNGEIVLFS